jgi:hypothetical protein
MPIKAKTGFANCFFQKVTVAGAAFSDALNPQVIVNVTGVNNYSLSNETAGSVVEVSYNGNFVQDELDSTQTTKFVQYNNRPVDTIWFRLKSGSAATVSVRCW